MPSQVYRTFRSICDTCLTPVPGELIAEGESVSQRKRCPEHGERTWPVSRHGADYVKFDHAYHRIFPLDEEPPQREDTYFFITNKCNQGCAYCVTEANSYPHFDDYDLRNFERELHRHPGSKASLIGGEPFRHPLIFDFVERIARAGKTVVVYTNGIALADEPTVRRLATASRGRCEVRMTFEGFEDADYTHLPIRRLREKKLAALANLEKHGLATSLGHTIVIDQAPGPQDGLRRSLRALIEYAMTHDYVRALTFQGTVGLGSARDLRSDEVMSVDRVMDEMVDALPIPYPRKHVYLIQRLVHLTARIFRLPICEWVQMAVLFRTGNRWVGLNHFLDCEALERRLDAIVAALPSSRAVLFVRLATAVLASARPAHLGQLFMMAARTLPIFFKRYDFASIPKTILPLLSISICDRYNLDESIARRCEKTVHSRVGEETIEELCSEMFIRQLRNRIRDQQSA
jgi:organic radical activating enzyme